MYLEHLVPTNLAAIFSPGCLVRKLQHPDLVSFGLLANLNTLSKRGVFDEVDAVIDVGANIGQFAYMAHVALPKLPIFSFEPDPVCFTGLQRTFAAHHISGKCFPLAISDREGQVALNVYESPANNSLLPRQNEHPMAVRQVNCATLDSLCTELSAVHAPFLKIDVQGAELAVLRGATEFLKRCKFVMLETSLVHSYEGNAHIADAFSFMRDAGFVCWEIVDALRKKKPDELGIVEMDLLFIRSGKRDED